ncbi:VanZ family protein [Lactococcus nasutitermitis]|uniref:VanZ family protein n=1 Tax=Lactococcus nasutitermitis TaxID=1652957 RepID=A0ABV9JI76_9LACT|nr:VanZ family protein [Lactococcus nasutitermitis]
MDKKIVKMSLTVVLSVLFFFLFIKFFVLFGEQLVGMSRTQFLFNHVGLLFTFYFAITLLFAVNLYQVLMLKFYRKFLVSEMLIYFVCTFLAIMFKSIGIRGINLNPLNFFSMYNQGFVVNVLNIIVFIPLGMYFYIKIKSMKKSLLIGLVIILGMEVSQYIFKLGIFDIDDILTNLLGIYFGFIIFESLYLFGVHGEKTSKFIMITLKRKNATHKEEVS